MVDIEGMIARIDAFQAAGGLSDTALGLRLKNDGKLIKRLRSGVNVRYDTLALIDEFIANGAAGPKAAPTTEAPPENPTSGD